MAKNFYARTGYASLVAVVQGEREVTRDEFTKELYG
jgi:hypothetical protein